MADVTISGLSPSTPSKDTAIIPFSDGSTTYKTSPSGIVAASPGSVIQVALATFNDKVSFSAASHSSAYTNFFNTYFTPKSNTSKVFIQALFYVGGNGGIRIRRNSTSIFEPVSFAGTNGAPYQFWSVNGSGPDSDTMRGSYCINWLDTPSTISQVTYQFDLRTYPNPAVGMGFNQNSYGTVGAPSTVTFMEIAG